MEGIGGHGVRRRFWCAWSGREVEVEFLARGLPGFRSLEAVMDCSAFEPPTAIECNRRCLDPGFRRLWQPPDLLKEAACSEVRR
jgi:hypothetical protein